MRSFDARLRTLEALEAAAEEGPRFEVDLSAARSWLDGVEVSQAAYQRRSLLYRGPFYVDIGDADDHEP